LGFVGVFLLAMSPVIACSWLEQLLLYETVATFCSWWGGAVFLGFVGKGRASRQQFVFSRQKNRPHRPVF